MKKDRLKKAVIGKRVADLAVKAKPEMKSNHARLSNWRQGLSLPRLDEFLEFCQITQTTDISPLLDEINN